MQKPPLPPCVAPEPPDASSLADVLADAYVALAWALGANVDVAATPPLRTALARARTALDGYMAQDALCGPVSRPDDETS